MPLGRVEYVSGAESQAETGEPHAVPDESQPDNVQGLTWCLAMGYNPEGSRVIDELEEYQKWRDYSQNTTALSTRGGLEQSLFLALLTFDFPTTLFIRNDAP